MQVIELDRGEFLRMGAAGVAGLTAAGLVPAAASAQTQAPAPQDDDIAFLSFATVAERTCRDFYRAAEDAGTRLLLGRLLTYDAQQIAWLRGAAGTFTPAGLPGPIDLEAAADQLDAFLSTPDFQE